MRAAALRAVLCIAAVAASTGCSSQTDSPTVVTPSPFVAQLSGQWSGSSTVVSVSGLLGSATGCVGGDVLTRLNAALLIPDDVALAVTQNGTSVTARYTSSGNGLSCSYTGSAALSAVVLDASQCDAQHLIFRCQDEGVREMQLVGSALAASVASGVMTGTVTDTYNVLQGGADDVTLILKRTLTASRR